MVRKLKSMEKADENALVEAVCSSAHQIWQAGLGAFAKAQEEGDEVFAKLVQEGAQLQKRTKHLAVEKGLGVTDTVTKLAENVGRQASGSWEKLEKVFEDRVSRSLRSLGVPTRDDIMALTRQIEELNKSVATLTGKEAAAATTAGKAAPRQRAVKAEGKPPANTALKRQATVRTTAKKNAGPAIGQA